DDGLVAEAFEFDFDAVGGGHGAHVCTAAHGEIGGGVGGGGGGEVVFGFEGDIELGGVDGLAGEAFGFAPVLLIGVGPGDDVAVGEELGGGGDLAAGGETGEEFEAFGGDAIGLGGIVDPIIPAGRFDDDVPGGEEVFEDVGRFEVAGGGDEDVE